MDNVYDVKSLRPFLNIWTTFWGIQWCFTMTAFKVDSWIFNSIIVNSVYFRCIPNRNSPRYRTPHALWLVPQRSGSKNVLRGGVGIWRQLFKISQWWGKGRQLFFIVWQTCDTTIPPPLTNPRMPSRHFAGILRETRDIAGNMGRFLQIVDVS